MRTKFPWKVIELFFIHRKNPCLCSFFQEIWHALKRTRPGNIAGNARIGSIKDVMVPYESSRSPLGMGHKSCKNWRSETNGVQILRVPVDVARPVIVAHKILLMGHVHMTTALRGGGTQNRTTVREVAWYHSTMDQSQMRTMRSQIYLRGGVGVNWKVLTSSFANRRAGQHARGQLRVSFDVGSLRRSRRAGHASPGEGR